MKICPTCQTQFKDGSMRFCTKDGTPLVAFVPPVIETPAATPLPPPQAPTPILSPLDETLSDIPMPSNKFVREPDFQQDLTTDAGDNSPSVRENEITFTPAEERLVVPVEVEPQRAAIAAVSPPVVQTATSAAPVADVPPKRKSNAVIFAILGILGLLALIGVGGAVGAYLYFSNNNKQVAVTNTNAQNSNAVPDADPANNNSSTDIGNGSTEVNANSNISTENSNANLDNNLDSNINIDGLSNLNANTRPTPTPRPTPSPKNANRNANEQIIIIEPSQPTPTPVVRPTATPPPATPQPQQGVKTVAGGVVNGKATSLPKPPYPASARAVRAEGQVNVQVLIDENGNVVSASAISGHPLLRIAAQQAARQAKFAPTVIAGQPARVSGVIIYNFTMN